MLRNHKIKILLSLTCLLSYLIYLEYHNVVRLKDLISDMVQVIKYHHSHMLYVTVTFFRIHIRSVKKWIILYS